MFLSNVDILNEIKRGNIKIEPLSENQIGPGSVDLTLSNEWWVFKKTDGVIDLSKTPWEEVMEKRLSDEIELKPGEMCLGKTVEKITLSNNIIGKLEGRSRYARMGLAIHITSAFVQPGVSNHQVLEIKNNSPFTLKIKSGMRISQIVFAYTKSPTSKPYSKYGNIAVNQ